MLTKLEFANILRMEIAISTLAVGTNTQQKLKEILPQNNKCSNVIAVDQHFKEEES